MFRSGLEKPNSHQRCAWPSAFMCSEMVQNKLQEAYVHDDVRGTVQWKPLFFKKCQYVLYLKNSMFKHSYRDEVEFLRSALKKGCVSWKFHQHPSKANVIRAKTMLRREFARQLFCARGRPDRNVSLIGLRGVQHCVFFFLRTVVSMPPGQGELARRRNNNTIPSCRGPVPSSRPGQFG